MQAGQTQVHTSKPTLSAAEKFKVNFPKTFAFFSRLKGSGDAPKLLEKQQEIPQKTKPILEMPQAEFQAHIENLFGQKDANIDRVIRILKAKEGKLSAKIEDRKKAILISVKGGDSRQIWDALISDKEFNSLLFEKEAVMKKLSIFAHEREKHMLTDKEFVSSVIHGNCETI